MSQDSISVHDLLATATEAALQAGSLVRKIWDEPLEVAEKGFRDLVTNADHASQALIVSIIQSQFPEHGFLVEESVAGLTAAGPVIWIIDPVDGTTNYSRYIPNYSISIAAAKRPNPSTPHSEPEILAGVIYDPIHQELFQAAAGNGALLNGKKIQVSKTNDLSRAIISIDWSHDPIQRQTTLDMVLKISPHIQTMRAIGSAALALAWVAAGRFDGYFNLNLKPWDVAAGKLLIEEAGGKLVTVDNLPWRLETTGFIAGNGRVSPELIVKLTVGQ